MDLRSYHTEVKGHSHDFAQLVLPVFGSMNLEVGTYSGMINETTGVYIAPNEYHHFSGSNNNLFLVIDITKKNTVLDASSRPQILSLTTSTKTLIQFIYQYLMENKRDTYTDSLIDQLLFNITTKSSFNTTDNAVLKAKEWINLYFSEPVSVEQVAEHCYLSSSQLQRRFKKETGYSVAEYWRMQKLHHAKSLLALSNASIAEIAFNIGYDTVSAFSRRFSEVFGKSPSQWRMTR